MLTQKRKCFVAAGLSCCALMGLVLFLEIGVTERNFSNNFVYVPALFAIFFAFWKMMEYSGKKEYLYSAGFSLFLSAILVIGAQNEYLEYTAFSLRTLLAIVLFSLFWLPISALALHVCKQREGVFAKPKLKWSKWKIFLLFSVVWFFAYLALYPGIYDYDSTNQTLQVLVTGDLYSNHPILHTLLLSGSLKLGELLTGSYGFGLGIFSFLQMLFLAYAAMRISWFLYEKQCSFLFYASLLFFAFVPLHYIMAVWVTKDVIFTGFFVLLSLELIRFSEDREGYFKNWKNIPKLVCLIFFTCAFRHNGFYALVLTVLLCAICLRKKGWKLVLVSAVSLLLFFGFHNWFLPWVGVKPGNMREMMSIPCQQLAKVYVERPEVFSEEEKELLFAYVPEQNLMDYRYRPMISDATKNYFNTERFEENPKEFLELYVKIGLRSPRKYVEAFLQNSLGFWYPNKSYPDNRLFHPYTEFEMADPNLFGGDYIYIARESVLPGYEEFLRGVILETEWTQIPVFSNLFVPGTYFVLLCFAAWYSAYRKQWSKMIVLSFWGAFWLTLLLSPVALIRYAYPVVVCLPLIGYLLKKNPPRSEEKAQEACLPQSAS